MLLAWAKDRDGARVRAARLDAASRRARGPFTCLGCGEPVVARLGPVRARHFAHLPGSTCPLTAPESALHLDAKERLLALCRDAFAGARRVSLVVRCPGCRRPGPRDLAAAGDAAVEEGAVGPLRADVLVVSGGLPALALEVKVTHALEPEKEAALSLAGIPAVEIDAREAWERDAPGGVEIQPARSLGFPPCPSCAALARADADRARGGEAAEIAELEAYRARGLLGVGPPPAGPPGAARLRGAGGARPSAGAGSRPPAAPGPRPPARADSPRRAARAAPPPPRGDSPLSPADRAALAREFRCPDCRGRELVFGERLASHPCPSAPDRPVAWRGYDGTVVSLGWWRRAPR